MKRINIYGPIVPNSYKWFYEWFDEDCACPRDVDSVLAEANGDDVEVYINSPGGVIDSGSEIYTMLKAYKGNVKIYITGAAHSAASIIAMARYCEMSPTALMMVHCVSSGASGNHNDMEKMAEILRTADDALSNAYVAKTGKQKSEILKMMEEETWLTAEKAKEIGLIDAIMFEQNNPIRLTASTFELPSEEKMNQIKELINKQTSKDESAFLMKKTKAQLNLMKLKGER
jgi:ATP-dependent Clp endopeptidase proteolytic subunit ClpP